MRFELAEKAMWENAIHRMIKFVSMAIVLATFAGQAAADDTVEITLFGMGGGPYTYAYASATSDISNQIASLDNIYLPQGYEKISEVLEWEDSYQTFPGYWVVELAVTVTYLKKGWEIIAPAGDIGVKTLTFEVKRPKKGMAYLRIYHFNAAGELILLGPPNWGVMPTGMVEVPGGAGNWMKDITRPGLPSGSNFRLELVIADDAGNYTVVDGPLFFQWNGAP